MAHIELKNITKKYGSTTALRDLDLDIADGEFFVLLGETGAPTYPRKAYDPRPERVADTEKVLKSSTASTAPVTRVTTRPISTGDEINVDVVRLPPGSLPSAGYVGTPVMPGAYTPGLPAAGAPASTIPTPGRQTSATSSSAAPASVSPAIGAPASTPASSSIPVPARPAAASSATAPASPAATGFAAPASSSRSIPAPPCRLLPGSTTVSCE